MNLRKVLKNKLEAKHVYYIIISIVYIYLIGKCIYQHIFGNGLYDCKLELLLMIILSLVVYIFSIMNVSFFNRKKRIKKDLTKNYKKKCLYESIFISLLITTFIYLLIAYNTIYIDFYNMIPNQEILSIFMLAVLLFLVFFVIIYFVKIYIIKKKNKMIK